MQLFVPPMTLGLEDGVLTILFWLRLSKAKLIKILTYTPIDRDEKGEFINVDLTQNKSKLFNPQITVKMR